MELVIEGVNHDRDVEISMLWDGQDKAEEILLEYGAISPYYKKYDNWSESYYYYIYNGDFTHYDTCSEMVCSINLYLGKNHGVDFWNILGVDSDNKTLQKYLEDVQEKILDITVENIKKGA